MEVLETGHAANNNQLKIVQEELAQLQNQKNKLLEDLSLVRGKMQSQKTAVAGDAQSLQVEVHGKDRKIQEIKAKIGETEKDKQQQEHSFVSQFKALEEVNKKLDELSQKLSNPAQIDWTLEDKELGLLENVWSGFYNKLQTSQNLDEVRQQAGDVGVSLQKFKKAAKSAMIDPHLGLLAVKQELDNLLKEKEQLS